MKLDENARYTSENPDLKGFDLEAMADLGAYPDGSGGGIHALAWELGKLREVRERIDLLDAFVRKYHMILARLRWSLRETSTHPTKKTGESKDLAVWVPEVELCARAYDKRRDAKPADIAQLWPDAQWRRTMPRFSHEEDTVRDWTADVDGVLIRITDAERKPKPKKVDHFGPCGPVRIF